MDKRILIIDDEPGLLKILGSRLKTIGYDVDIAENGIRGFDKIRENKPDLIILDLMMPGMDGFKFFKKIKDKEETAKIPIVVLSAKGEIKESFLALGADSFLCKPFALDELSATLDSVFFNKLRYVS